MGHSKFFFLGLLCLLFVGAQGVFAQQAEQPAGGTSGGLPQQTQPGATTAPAQGTPAQGTTAPAAPRKSFSAELAKATSALGWARVYHDSFRRSGEYRYLRLAGKQALQGIEILYQTQNSLKRTERFYYKVRQKRIDYCRYFELLKEDSLTFGSRKVLRDPPSSRCRF